MDRWRSNAASVPIASSWIDDQIVGFWHEVKVWKKDSRDERAEKRKARVQESTKVAWRAWLT